jgi:gamma-glutamyltranspeptidase / glutathione hydrolase
LTALARLQENAAVSGPKVVSAGHPLAAAAGATIFARRGNAFDAALAACFMEHIALPMKCGLAGDLVALFRRNGGPFQALVSIGAGAAGLASGVRMHRVGPTSVGIPGAPHGYTTLHDFANLTLDELVAPAVRAASQGIPWTRVARDYVVEAKDLLAEYSPNNPYSAGGRIPEIGEIRRMPGLGALLNSFVECREALFEGSIGIAIANRLQATGGIISREDFAQRPAQIHPAATETIADGFNLTVTPLPTHGPELIGIVRRALSSEVPLPQIVLEARAAAKQRGREPQDGGTSAVLAADDQGNVVAVLHSNSFPQFASGIVLDNGLILNNRPGRGFDVDALPGSVNAPKAGRVPWTTLHAWCLTRKDGLVVGATPGGVNQLPWNAQTVTEIARGGVPESSVVAPRWSLDAQGALAVEGDFDPGMASSAIEPFSLRSAQQLIVSSDFGLHRVAADPRTGATAFAVY